MGQCRRVIGSTDDGKHVVVCGKQVPCPDHFPIPRTTVPEARFWPTSANPARYVPVVDLPQISDEDWQRMAEKPGRHLLIVGDHPKPVEGNVCPIWEDE